MNRVAMMSTITATSWSNNKPLRFSNAQALIQESLFSVILYQATKPLLQKCMQPPIPSFSVIVTRPIS